MSDILESGENEEVFTNKFLKLLKKQNLSILLELAIN